LTEHNRPALATNTTSTARTNILAPGPDLRQA